MERNSKNAAHGWHADGVKSARTALSQVVWWMNQTKTLKTACRCAQFCMLRMSTCVASFILLSTMVSPMMKVCLSLYTLLRSHFRSHLFVNCCIRRYSLYTQILTSLGCGLQRYFMRRTGVWVSVFLQPLQDFSTQRVSPFYRGFPFIWFWVFGWLGSKQQVSPFYHLFNIWAWHRYWMRNLSHSDLPLL